MHEPQLPVKHLIKNKKTTKLWQASTCAINQHKGAKNSLQDCLITGNKIVREWQAPESQLGSWGYRSLARGFARGGGGWCGRPTSRVDHATPVVHVFLIASVAVIIPIHVLLHHIIALRVVGAVGVMRQAHSVAMLSIIPVVVQRAQTHGWHSGDRR